MTTRWKQTATVIGLVPLGAAVGAAVGFVTIIVLGMSTGAVVGTEGLVPAMVLALIFGAPIGVVLGPFIGAALLPRVRLCRIVLVTSAASVLFGVGAARLAMLDWKDGAGIAAIPGAVVGGIVAAVWLRLHASRPREDSSTAA